MFVNEKSYRFIYIFLYLPAQKNIRKANFFFCVLFGSLLILFIFCLSEARKKICWKHFSFYKIDLTQKYQNISFNMIARVNLFSRLVSAKFQNNNFCFFVSTFRCTSRLYLKNDNTQRKKLSFI